MIIQFRPVMLFIVSFVKPQIVSQSRSTTFSNVAKTSFRKPIIRSSFHICSIGFISGVYGGVKQFNIVRNLELFWFMPTSSVAAQQDQIIRVLLWQPFKKYVHAIGIAIWHYQKEGVPRHWFNGSVCIPIFTNVMTWYRWPGSFFAPAVLWFIDPAKSGFILEHQTNCFAGGKLF